MGFATQPLADILLFVFASQFQAALPAVVVDIIAEVFFINGSVHTAVFSPEEEAATLEKRLFSCEGYLSKVTRLVPSEVI